MKVFVPIPDSALEVNDGVYRSLIPFDPAFLAGNLAREGRKPSNWISGSDYESQTGHKDYKKSREHLYAGRAGSGAIEPSQA